MGQNCGPGDKRKFGTKKELDFRPGRGTKENFKTELLKKNENTEVFFSRIYFCSYLYFLPATNSKLRYI